MKFLALSLCLAFCLACGGGGGGGSDTPLRQEPSQIYVEETADLESNMVSFKPINSSSWDETKVRKILHTFALGAQVSDQTIQKWATMPAEDAIDEILSLNVFNPNYLEAPTDKYIAGELTALSEVWSREKDRHGESQEHRYGLESWNGPAEVWIRAMRDPNLNPVRQRIGLYETNDHMAINLESEASSRQIFRYYDDIMNALASGESYEKVIGVAARSAAIATQYNHRENKFVDGAFEGNEDFAREFHQLFFGILGMDEPEHHEKVNIRNTAKALTDMKVKRENGSYLKAEVEFGEEEHYPGDLDILHSSISGNTAEAKLSELIGIAIDNVESLENLPLKIVQYLSDPTPSAERTSSIQQAWQANSEKSLLAFLRRYAISDAFHHEERFRYWNTLERLMIIEQRMKTSEEDENFTTFVSSWEMMQIDSSPFRPFHDVFGSMQGYETAQTSDHFRKAWEVSTKDIWGFVRYEVNGWKRDWTRAMAPDEDGNYSVKHVAEWLWQRFIADGLKNFGLLERSQVYALLASGMDYQLFVDEEQPFADISTTDLNAEPHLEIMNDLSITRMQLNSEEENQLKRANERIGLAIAFITMTPYMFGQEGL